MKLIRPPGTTNQTIYVEILNSTSTTSGGLTGLLFNATGLIAYYTQTRGASAAMTLATLSSPTAAWSSGGFIEVDSTHQKGIYRLDLPNAVLAAGADSVVVVLSGAANMVDCRIEIDLGVPVPPTPAQVATGIWQDATAADFTVASSIGKSLYTAGNAPGATNGLSLVGSNMGSVTSVTAAITLPSIPTNWITAAGINAGALNGKGDWLLASSYTAPPTTAAIATAVWTDTTAGDFTTLTSPGKIIFAQLGGAFTTTSSSVFTAAALANAPTGGIPPTVTQIATAVWQDATAGDFTVASSIGKSLYTTGNAPGAASGLALVGSNMGSAASVTAAVTLPSIPANWITAAGINAGALNGKGDWLLISTAIAATGNTANTVADCLNAARAQGFGKWVISGTTLNLYANDGTTVVRAFTLDSGTSPTQRA